MYKDKRQIVQIYWRAASQHRRLMSYVLLAVFLATLCYQVVAPLFAAMILSKATRSGTTGGLWPLIIGFSVTLYCGDVLLWRAADYFAWKLEGNVVRDTVTKATTGSGAYGIPLVSVRQVTALIEGYTSFADAIIYQVAPLMSALVSISIVLLFVAPLFAGFFTMASIFYIAISPAISRQTRTLRVRDAQVFDAQYTALEQALTKPSATREYAALQRADQAYESLMRMKHAHTYQQLTSKTLITIFLIFALSFGALAAQTHHISLATAVLIVMYANSVALQLFTYSNTTIRNLDVSFRKTRAAID